MKNSFIYFLEQYFIATPPNFPTSQHQLLFAFSLYSLKAFLSTRQYMKHTAKKICGVFEIRIHPSIIFLTCTQNVHIIVS